MNEACPGEPDADEDGHELAESDVVGRLEEVEVLQHVGHGHEAQRTREAQPCIHTLDLLLGADTGSLENLWS